MRLCNWLCWLFWVCWQVLYESLVGFRGSCAWRLCLVGGVWREAEGIWDAGRVVGRTLLLEMLALWGGGSVTDAVSWQVSLQVVFFFSLLLKYPRGSCSRCYLGTAYRMGGSLGERVCKQCLCESGCITCKIASKAAGERGLHEKGAQRGRVAGNCAEEAKSTAWLCVAPRPAAPVAIFGP